MIYSRKLWVVVLTLSTAACGAKMDSTGGNNSRAAGPANSAQVQTNTTPQYAGVAPAALNYQGSILNADVALNGMGKWVQIGDQRFFVPSNNLVGRDWEPYQNGHWMYDRDRGWTWVSDDRFGWLTDHYGIWRHHRIHGWVWLPFHDMRYVPHTATWWDDGDSSPVIGWYPYYADYPQGYTLGSVHGFNDGYWRGNAAIIEHVSGNSTFHLGISLIRREDAGERNLRRVMIRDRNYIWGTAQRAHKAGRFNRDGRHPGGEKDRAYGFLQLPANKKLKIGRAKTIRSRGGAKFMQPKAEISAEEQKQLEKQQEKTGKKRSKKKSSKDQGEDLDQSRNR